MEVFEGFMPLIIILIIWEVIWKLIAMWKAARNNHIAWFICIALINTAGILPLIYILIHRKKSASIKLTKAEN
ncbi:MAG: hypothetical protein H0V01_01270 [Bacteroidetes bacterium]|nr:hypothetical protein [Bacteroidota bacterium]